MYVSIIICVKSYEVLHVVIYTNCITVCTNVTEV